MPPRLRTTSFELEAAFEQAVALPAFEQVELLLRLRDYLGIAAPPDPLDDELRGETAALEAIGLAQAPLTTVGRTWPGGALTGLR